VVKFLAVQDVSRADVRVLENRERHTVSGDRAAVHDPDISVNRLLEGGRSRLGMDAGNGSDSGCQAQGSNGGEGQVFPGTSPSLGRARCPAVIGQEMGLCCSDNNPASQQYIYALIDANRETMCGAARCIMD
jgi:hypothetical protein